MHYATSTHYLSPRQGPSLVAHARKSWSPVVALVWPGHGNGIPSTGGHKGPNPAPTPLPPLRETRHLAILSFCIPLACCVLGYHKGPPVHSPAPTDVDGLFDRLMRIWADKSAVRTINRRLLDDDGQVHIQVDTTVEMVGSGGVEWSNG